MVMWGMRDLEGWIDWLRLEQPLVIVEGFKDKVSLRKLGLTRVTSLKGKPLYKVVEYVASVAFNCVILTDLDAEGKKIYGELKQGLQRHKVKVDDRFRQFLFKETELRQIEGLYTYVSRQLHFGSRYSE